MLKNHLIYATICMSEIHTTVWNIDWFTQDQLSKLMQSMLPNIWSAWTNIRRLHKTIGKKLSYRCSLAQKEWSHSFQMVGERILTDFNYRLITANYIVCSNQFHANNMTLVIAMTTFSSICILTAGASFGHFELKKEQKVLLK